MVVVLQLLLNCCWYWLTMQRREEFLGIADLLRGLLLHTVTAGNSTDLECFSFTETLTLYDRYLVPVVVTFETLKITFKLGRL